MGCSGHQLLLGALFIVSDHVSNVNLSESFVFCFFPYFQTLRLALNMCLCRHLVAACVTAVVGKFHEFQRNSESESSEVLKLESSCQISWRPRASRHYLKAHFSSFIVNYSLCKYSTASNCDLWWVLVSPKLCK